MIAANVEAAKRMHKRKIPGLYRIHEGPDADKLEELRAVPAHVRLQAHRRARSARRRSTGSSSASSGKPEAELDRDGVLRSMMQARYQPDNVGHFGLALGAYAHFTSPIRRYPDLLVHRAIKWLE